MSAEVRRGPRCSCPTRTPTGQMKKSGAFVFLRHQQRGQCHRYLQPDCYAFARAHLCHHRLSACSSHSPCRCVFNANLVCLGAGDAKVRHLGATSVGAPLSAHIYHPVLLVLRVELCRFGASDAIAGLLGVQPVWMHLVLTTFTIPPLLCAQQAELRRLGAGDAKPSLLGATSIYGLLALPIQRGCTSLSSNSPSRSSVLKSRTPPSWCRRHQS